MSLYLKYRPQDFDNLVWQDFINKTLKKAISEDKTIWAYLFCWPRWTGKTSTARIFAKTVNCENQKEWNPCLKCSICKDFSEEKLIDIIEIDAASHTWVDNIREIIEKANFRPTKTKYKIYIIDEVHMLSKWAFNALLKILEEPPKHVKFILATTETHKVPETIISRCQRYDFKKISADVMKERLSYIAKSEWIKIDKEALDYIEKSSSGWLRNAISLFEQLIDSGKIEYKHIVEKLWIVSGEKLDIFLNKLLNKDTTIIEDFDNLVWEGKNLKLFFKELIFFAKDKALSKIAAWEKISDILKTLEILDETYTKTKTSLDENTTFMIWVLKILNWEYTEITTQTTTSKKTETKVPKKEIIIEEKPKVKVEENITHDDIWDVFWDISTPELPKSNTPNSSWSFNKEWFIKELKECGAKWWLTMWIRWADTSVSWDNLNIKFKTNFALKAVNTTDNISLMNRALEKLWLEYKITMS